jgi:hypothetical protein
MAGENTASTISAWLKEVYADSLDTLIPEGVRLLKMVPFNAGDKELGDNYIQPVCLTHEHGFTVGSGAFTLNAAINATYAEAQVAGKNLLLRTSISYDAAAKASNSKKAFMKWSEQVVGNMTSSFTKRLEVLHFYGAASLGKVSAVDTGVITITTATWASGIWAGSEGTIIEAFTALTGGSQHDGDLTISAVDIAGRTVTVTGTSSSVVANDLLFYKGFRGSEMNGIDKLCTNTGSLYNISATTYALWAGNSYSAGSASLTFGKIQRAVALAVGKGLDEKVTLFCSPATYADLNTDLAALRKFDSSYKAGKGDNGYESISFYGVNGEIEIVPSIYVKEGEAFCVPVKKLKRIGSTDVTMRMPGMSDEQLVTQSATLAAYEMRLFYDGNLFCERPGYLVKITNIVNAA